MRILVFTDLDGTLLAHDSYSWEGARPVLDELKRQGIPLVFCTSKTRAEVRSLRRAIGNTDPFIVENGGVVVIPASRSSRVMPAKKHERTLMLGRPYREVTAALRKLARQAGVDVRGFHQMTDEEVVERTGLSIKEAHHARQRETGEPFLFPNASAREIRAFSRMAHESGYSLQRGGRFWHISGNCDKGLALSTVISYYRAVWRTSIRTIALGDSGNDLPMLQLVNQPILMPKPDGTFDKEITTALPRVLRCPEPGPEAWGQAVLEAIGRNAKGTATTKTNTAQKSRMEKALHYGT